METANPKRRNRVVGWAANKFNGSTLAQVNEILAENARKTRERAKPADLTREDVEAGLSGRYADGGKARFDELFEKEGWTEEGLAKRASRWRLQALFYLLGAIIALGASLAWVLTSPGWFAVLMLVPGLCVPLGLLAIALKADFAAWQIRSRRFGGLRDYFRSNSGS